MHGIIDGDILSHISASAGEYRYIDVTFPDGSMDNFENRTALKEHCNFLDIPYKECVIEDQQLPEPLPNVIHTAKMIIQRWVKEAGVDTYEVVTGFGKGFRDTLPLPEKYKDRSSATKAVHVDAVKEWILEQPWGYDATQWNIESDDELSIRAYQGYLKWKKSKKRKDVVVQITTDKDGMGCTGFIFNPDKMSKIKLVEGVGHLEISKVSNQWKVSGWGTKFLAYQCLCGDNVDSYKPTKHIKKAFGPVKCYDLIGELETEAEVWGAVADQYKEWFGDDHEYTDCFGVTHKVDWLHMMDLYFKCAYMLRSRDDTRNVKSILEDIGYES